MVICMGEGRLSTLEAAPSASVKTRDHKGIRPVASEGRGAKLCRRCRVYESRSTIELARGPVFRQHRPPMGLGRVHARRSAGREILALFGAGVHPHLASAWRPAKGAKLGGPAPPSRPIRRRPCAIHAGEHVREDGRTQERACDRPGCTEPGPGRSTAQMEAFATKRPPPPACAPSASKSWPGSRTSRSPAPYPGCTRDVGVLAAGAAAGGRARRRAGRCPTQRCGQCEGVYRKAEGPPGQLRHQRLQPQVDLDGRRADPGLRRRQAQRAAAPHARRVQAGFGAIADREVRCRTSGCKKTWTWSRSNQLDACLAGKPTPRRRRACARVAYGIYQNVKDVERPCRRPAARERGSTSAAPSSPRRARQDRRSLSAVLRECEKELGDLEDRQVPCKTDNCTDVDLDEGRAARGRRASRDEGVEEPSGDGREATRRRPPGRGRRRRVPPPASLPAAARRPVQEGRERTSASGVIKPPERRCQECSEFLKDKKTLRFPARSADADLLAAREPAADAPRHVGRAGACAAPASATRPKRRAPRSARRWATWRMPGRAGGRRRRPLGDSSAAPPAHSRRSKTRANCCALRIAGPKPEHSPPPRPAPLPPRAAPDTSADPPRPQATRPGASNSTPCPSPPPPPPPPPPLPSSPPPPSPPPPSSPLPPPSLPPPPPPSSPPLPPPPSPSPSPPLPLSPLPPPNLTRSLALAASLRASG